MSCDTKLFIVIVGVFIVIAPILTIWLNGRLTLKNYLRDMFYAIVAITMGVFCTMVVTAIYFFAVKFTC